MTRVILKSIHADDFCNSHINQVENKNNGTSFINNIVVIGVS